MTAYPDGTNKINDHSESLADLFHLVGNLITEEQMLVTVSPEDCVADALRRMEAHNYSQLPVMVGSYVLGVFSYRSLARGLLTMGEVDGNIGDLPVEEFVEQLQFVHASDNWEAVVSHLDRDDGVLVGTRQELESLLTAMDGLTYLQSVTAPFVLLAEIERSLRQIIGACVSVEELQSCIDNALSRHHGEDRVPQKLLEMTFNDYILLVEHTKNWPKFALAFGENSGSRSRLGKRLRQLRELRNDTFHFRRKLTPDEVRALARHRNWFQMKVWALRAELSEPSKLGDDKPTDGDYRRLLERTPVPHGQRQLYAALHEAGDRGLTYSELAETMGRGDRHRAPGVVGALGHRVNGTPGYGETHQPGANMVLDWQELPDGDWRLRLKPEMRAVLEEINPPWLHQVVT